MKLIKYIPENERIRRPSQLVAFIGFLLFGLIIIGVGCYPATLRIDAYTIVGLICIPPCGLLIIYSSFLILLNWIANGPVKAGK